MATSSPAMCCNRASLSYDTDTYSVTLFASNIFDKYAVSSVDNDRSRVGINDGITVRYYRQTVISSAHLRHRRALQVLT